ncbi:MAG TPA: hypothetical protein PLH27_13525 [bacterium]|nr:hypothetical protein [bacterium]HNC50006.1 hypothetical protein [bacterium]HND78167.1 hypothetical protein [bacterium]HNE84666.1 hypothetical protein [bacterium]HNH30115.1 hypothetical protein [bacterium]
MLLRSMKITIIVALGLGMLKSCSDDSSYESIAGEWEGTVFTGEGDTYIEMKLEQDAENVSGYFRAIDQFSDGGGDSGTIEGTMDGDQFTGHAHGSDCSPDIDMTLTHPDTLAGHVHMGACDDGATHALTVYRKPTL